MANDPDEIASPHLTGQESACGGQVSDIIAVLERVLERVEGLAGCLSI